MQRAARFAPLPIIQLLVQHGAEIKNTNLLPHATLSYISTAGDPGRPDRLEVINYLIDQGASINAFYNDTLNADVPSGDGVFYEKMTALHFAVVGGEKELVKALLERGADSKLETWSAWKSNGKFVSSVELARICGFEDIALVLEEWVGEHV